MDGVGLTKSTDYIKSHVTGEPHVQADGVKNVNVKLSYPKFLLITIKSSVRKFYTLSLAVFRLTVKRNGWCLSNKS
jgi:hypothetical protein